MNPIKLIKKSKYIIIATHENPDTDTMCCAIAMGLALKQLEKKYKIYNSSKNISHKYKIFENYGKITNIEPAFYDLAIYVDCATTSRVGAKLSIDTTIINIDHHQSNNNFGDINIVDASAVSCGLVVYGFLKTHGITIDKDMASALYLSIYDDSKAFTKHSCGSDIYSTIDDLTKLGATPNHLSLKFLQTDSLSKYRLLPKIYGSLKLHDQGRIATIKLRQKWLTQTKADISSGDDVPYDILNIKIVKIVLYFKQLQHGQTKVSIRAKGGINISKLANFFDGGGHKSSLSLKFKDKSIKCIKNVIIDKIKESNIV